MDCLHPSPFVSSERTESLPPQRQKFQPISLSYTTAAMPDRPRLFLSMKIAFLDE